jgi:hypothetical protein
MTRERKRIVVVGAASQQGASVVDALLKYPDQWSIRGITRDRLLPFSQVEYFSTTRQIVILCIKREVFEN